MSSPPDSASASPEAGAERRLHPWSWLFVLLQQLRQFIVPLLVLLFLGRGDRNQLFPLIGVGVLAVLSVWQYFTYRYAVGEDRLVVRSGLFERSVRQIPFARIHNVALHQTLLHRLFGVAEVRLESAGGKEPEAQMRVLRLQEALALERLVRRHGSTAHAATASPAASDDTVLLALPTTEVLRLGLISNRGMVVVAGAFALSWQVVPDDLMTDLVRDGWRRALGYAQVGDAGLGQQAVAAVALLLLALVLVRLFSVLLAVVQYHGFRLLAHGRRLTVERGLLTRLRTSASRRRIQAWTLQETLLHRWFGRRSLHVDTAVSESQDDQRALRELAPVATPRACDALVGHVLPRIAWPPAEWMPLHRRAWWRLMPAGIVVSAALVAAGSWRFDAWGLLGLLWLPWAALAARRHAAFAAYAADATLVAVREGWWSRHWRFAEIDKLQALQLRQSPLDRAFGMASLWLDTTGAGAMAPPLRVRWLPEDAARALYQRLSATVARRPVRGASARTRGTAIN
jgi:putative membrane protein